MRNEILLKRMCQLVSQTFAVPTEWIFERAKDIGIEAIVEILENDHQNKPKF